MQDNNTAIVQTWICASASRCHQLLGRSRQPKNDPVFWVAKKRGVMRERARGEDKEDEEGEAYDSVLSAYEAFALALAATVLKNYFPDYREAFGIDELGITESEAAGIVLAHAVFAVFPGAGNVRMTSAVLQTYFGADMDEWFEGVIDELVKELGADIDRSQLWPAESEMHAAKTLNIVEIEQDCEAGKWAAYADALNVLSGCYWSRKEALQ